jgi:hypothetical protein
VRCEPGVSFQAEERKQIGVVRKSESLLPVINVGTMIRSHSHAQGAPILLLMIHGKDMVIPEGTPVKAFVSGDTTITPGAHNGEAQ